MPKVSVIIPNYNHAPYLRKRIESVLNQTFTDFELILLDDCSTDNSREIMSEYRSNEKVSKIEFNLENAGNTFKQWQKGLSSAAGEYVWIAESDDFADGHFLEKTVQTLEIDHSLALCWTQSYLVTPADEIKGKYKYTENAEIFEKGFFADGNTLIDNYLQYYNIIPNASAVLFRRNAFENIDWEKIHSFQIDGDWFLYINALQDRACAYISAPLNYFRRHEQAGSINNVLKFKHITEAFQMCLYIGQMGKKANYRYYFELWLSQCNYNYKTLFKSNFCSIYRMARKLYRFVFPYLMFSILYHRLKAGFIAVFSDNYTVTDLFAGKRDTALY